MDRPMRVYGQNVYEIVLADVLLGLGLVCVALGIAGAITPGSLLPGSGVGAGLLAGGAIGAGVLFVLASGGVRQNRGAVDGGLELFALVSLAWLIWGIASGDVVAVVIGALATLALALTLLLRSWSVRARFKPRYLSPRKFETLVQVVDVMIDGDGREAASPEEVAVRTDHLLDRIRSPVTDEIRKLLFVVEFLLPLMVLRPLAFSAMGTAQRRRALERVIGRKGLFRDVARSLKLLACAGYYGHPDAMRSIGFVHFEARDRFPGTDTRPPLYPDPFERPPSPVA